MPPLRTFVVDDHEDLGKLLKSMLQAKTECVVIGEASEGLQAVEQAKELQPVSFCWIYHSPKLNEWKPVDEFRKFPTFEDCISQSGSLP